MRSHRLLSSLRGIKSIHSAGVRSIPRVHRSGYLDLYTLAREKDRLEKETSALDRRRTAAARQLETVTGRIVKLQQETGLKGRAAAPKGARNMPARTVKTMTIRY